MATLNDRQAIEHLYLWNTCIVDDAPSERAVQFFERVS